MKRRGTIKTYGRHRMRVVALEGWSSDEDKHKNIFSFSNSSHDSSDSSSLCSDSSFLPRVTRSNRKKLLSEKVDVNKENDGVSTRRRKGPQVNYKDTRSSDSDSGTRRPGLRDTTNKLLTKNKTNPAKSLFRSVVEKNTPNRNDNETRIDFSEIDDFSLLIESDNSKDSAKNAEKGLQVPQDSPAVETSTPYRENTTKVSNCDISHISEIETSPGIADPSASSLQHPDTATPKLDLSSIIGSPSVSEAGPTKDSKRPNDNSDLSETTSTLGRKSPELTKNRSIAKRLRSQLTPSPCSYHSAADDRTKSLFDSPEMSRTAKAPKISPEVLNCYISLNRLRDSFVLRQTRSSDKSKSLFDSTSSAMITRSGKREPLGGSTGRVSRSLQGRITLSDEELEEWTSEEEGEEREGKHEEELSHIIEEEEEEDDESDEDARQQDEDDEEIQEEDEESDVDDSQEDDGKTDIEKVNHQGDEDDEGSAVDARYQDDEDDEESDVDDEEGDVDAIHQDDEEDDLEVTLYSLTELALNNMEEEEEDWVDVNNMPRIPSSSLQSISEGEEEEEEEEMEEEEEESFSVGSRSSSINSLSNSHESQDTSTESFYTANDDSSHKINNTSHKTMNTSQKTMNTSHRSTNSSQRLSNSTHHNTISSCNEKTSTLPKPVLPTSPHNTSISNLSRSFVEMLTPSRNIKNDQQSPRSKILSLCQHGRITTFTESIPLKMLNECVKIGEGVYGEVFKATRNKSSVAIKIVPIEGDFLVNDEKQKTFAEVLPEVLISIELSELRNNIDTQTDNFCQVNSVSCVKGAYPKQLLKQWDLYDEKSVSENDRPDIFKDNQLFIVFEFADGGSDLESFKFNNPLEAKSVLIQTAYAMAVAEEAFEFEHRDLHIGNVLVRRTEEEYKDYQLQETTRHIECLGVHVCIIDFTMSRLMKDGVVIHCDLAEDETLFEGKGDYQFDIYRMMKEHNKNKWKCFKPYTNVLWLHYLTDAILKRKKFTKNSRQDREVLKEMRNFHKELLNYDSAKHVVLASDLCQPS